MGENKDLSAQIVRRFFEQYTDPIELAMLSYCEKAIKRSDHQLFPALFGKSGEQASGKIETPSPDNP